MKTSIIEVGGVLSVLSARGVEKQVARLPGVERVEVNYAAGSATVVYDETLLDLKILTARVRDCGYHCGGELTPKHVCATEDLPTVAAASPPMATHAAPEAAAHAGHAKSAARAGEMDSTAHEMGHGAGMDMQAMVRDMRNRFWICLAFSVPIFVYSPLSRSNLGCVRAKRGRPHGSRRLSRLDKGDHVGAFAESPGDEPGSQSCAHSSRLGSRWRR